MDELFIKDERTHKSVPCLNQKKKTLKDNIFFDLLRSYTLNPTNLFIKLLI